MNLKFLFYKLLTFLSSGKLKNKFEIKAKKSIKNSTFIFSYAHNRTFGKPIRNNYNFDPEIGNLAEYQTLNKIKEIELKNKVKDGKKIKVCFLVDSIQRFPFASIYKNMLKSELFEPFLILYYHNDKLFKTNKEVYIEHKESFKFLKEKNYIIFDGYDEEKNFIPIENFHPDIIFTCSPYLDYHSIALTNIYLNINYLVCYLNYTTNVLNNYQYIYNNRRIDSCYKHFVQTRDDFDELLDYSKYCGINAVLAGIPKLDAYSKPLNKCQIPDKINNGKPIVIYAPHHSIRNRWQPVNLATFHLYHDYFLSLLDKYPDINFVFKPHPDLIYTVEEKNIMTSSDYLKYIEKWNNHNNGLYIYDGEYIDLFQKADLLIMDCASFIAEWLPSKKPCMYLINPERKPKIFYETLTSLGEKIMNVYYKCNNLKEINDTFKMLIQDKQDPLKTKREELSEKLFENPGQSGKFIVNYLENIFTN